jgi:hypothetical protein
MAGANTEKGKDLKNSINGNLGQRYNDPKDFDQMTVAKSYLTNKTKI